MRYCPFVRAAVLLLAVGMLAGPGTLSAQERITDKFGRAYTSGERPEERAAKLPNFDGKEISDVNSTPILMIPDGLRRVFIPLNSLTGKADVPPTAFERFMIPQMVTSGGKVLFNIGPIIKRGPFDQFGQRTLVMASAQGPVPHFQGVTEINPRYIKVEGLGGGGGAIETYVSDMRFRTNSIPAEELRAMMYEVLNRQGGMGDARERLRVYRLFFQAGRYADAADELDSIIKQFPNLAELKTQQQSLLQIGAQEFIREIERRAESGQHNLAIARLQNFPQEGIAGETLIRVKRKLKDYEDMLTQRDGIIAALERDLGEVTEPDFKKGLEEIITEIKETIKISTLPRLADYDRLKDDKSLPADQRYALAVSGWVLGQGFTKAKTLSVALSAFETRKLVWRYMKASGKEERATILKLIESQEAGNPEFLSRIVVNMLPFGDVPKVMEGAPPGFFELTCRGVSPDAPPTTYYVQLPPEYDPRRFYPTIVALHGQNARAPGQIDWWCGPALPDGMRPGQATRHGYIVIAPSWSKNGAATYQFSAEEHAAVLNSLRDAMKRFSVDTDRVFLTGLAAGADAAWDIGLSHPDLWAGVLPICPQVDEKQNTDRYLSWYEENGKGLPFYFVCGEKDGSPLSSRWGKLITPQFKSKAYDCTVIEYQGRGLEDYFEDVIEMFRWMEFCRRDFKRKKFDDFTTMRPWDNFAWCMEIEELAPRWVVLPLAWPPAKGFRVGRSSFNIADNNHITVKCDLSDRVTLWLSPDFVDFEKPIRVLRSKVTTVKEQPSAEVLLEDVRTRGDRQHPFWMKVTL